MKCAICGREFVKRKANQRFCSALCRREHLRDYQRNYQRDRQRYNQYHREYENGTLWFNQEWQAWNRDFALGKTASNCEVTQ